LCAGNPRGTGSEKRFGRFPIRFLEYNDVVTDSPYLAESAGGSQAGNGFASPRQKTIPEGASGDIISFPETGDSATQPTVTGLSYKQWPGRFQNRQSFVRSTGEPRSPGVFLLAKLRFFESAEHWELQTMKAILDSPMLYHTFQRAIGGFSARVKAINEYLSLKQGQVVIDIGCGPGHIAAHLPRGVDYHGFDIEPQYIEYAKRHFGGVAAFHCRMFDADAARTLGLADVVMMNGVLHHMDDSTVRMI